MSKESLTKNGLILTFESILDNIPKLFMTNTAGNT